MSILIKEFKSIEQLEDYLNKNFCDNSYFDEIKTVLLIAFTYDLLPKPRSKSITEKNGYLNWIFARYKKAYESRSAHKTGKPMRTISDSMVNHILRTRLSLSEATTKEFISNHRQAMNAENIIGSLLEEYIDSVLKKTKWVCCYGEILHKCDFCHPDGMLVQVKNRDNSENSSSSAIRKGTEINKWYRSKATTGTTNWEAIYQVFHAQQSGKQMTIDNHNVSFSEDGFKVFVTKIIDENPDCIFIESN